MQIRVYRSQMAADGVFSTPSDAILWAIYTDLQGFATRGALLESSQGSTTKGADLESGQFYRIYFGCALTPFFLWIMLYILLK